MEYKYFSSSQKPYLIFLHGWGGCWQSWFPILERLKNDFNILAIDLPGFGDQEINKALTLDDYVNFVVKTIKDKKIIDPILIGHSFGGAIVSKIAAKKIIPLKKIILVDAAPIRYQLTSKQKIISSITKPTKKILSLPILNRLYTPLQKFLYKSLKLEDSGYFGQTNPLIKKTFSNVIREDLTNILPNIKVPTLIIWGENDTATPLSAGRKIQQLISKSKLIVYPNSSHFSYLENQDLFVQDVKKFIKK